MNDVLMVKCPIDDPEGRHQLLQARLDLLLSRGHKWQLFLPAKLLDDRPTRTGEDRFLPYIPFHMLQKMWH